MLRAPFESVSSVPWLKIKCHRNLIYWPSIIHEYVKLITIWRDRNQNVNRLGLPRTMVNWWMACYMLQLNSGRDVKYCLLNRTKKLRWTSYPKFSLLVNPIILCFCCIITENSYNKKVLFSLTGWDFLQKAKLLLI